MGAYSRPRLTWKLAVKTVFARALCDPSTVVVGQQEGLPVFPWSHQNKIPLHFADIPGRFLKIPGGTSGVYDFSSRLHLPYTDPLLAITF